MMGLAGAKRNKCAPVLSPFEIEGARHDENGSGNPILIAWYDFSEPSTMFSYESLGQDIIEDGERVMVMRNKCSSSGFNHTTRGSRALGSQLLGTTASQAPYWTAPSDGNPGYATFDGSANALYGMGTTGPAVTGTFSDSQLTMNNFFMVAVCQRDDPDSPQYQDVFSIYDKTGNNLMLITFEPTEVYAYTQVASASDKYTRYNLGTTPIPDDNKFHYHYVNGNQVYSGSTAFVTVESDGFRGKWNYVYNNYNLSGSHSTTMQFDNVSANNFVGIGCSKSGINPNNARLFKGKIYEVMIFNEDLRGGALAAPPGFEPNQGRMTDKFVVEYLKRKYSYSREKL